MAISTSVGGLGSTRTCKACGETKPLDLFARTNASTGDPAYLRTCKACYSAERNEKYRRRRASGLYPSSSTERERLARVREAYGHAEVDTAPDPAVPRMLGELLREDRDNGYDFATAWREDVAFVCGRLARPKREQWREAFEATCSAWEASWHGRAGAASQLSLALLDDPRDAPAALASVA